jgi:agmatine deiminase
MPAEWEAVDAVLMAWPDASTDWEEVLAAAQDCVARIAHASAQFAQVLMISAEPDVTAATLGALGCAMDQIIIVEQKVGDTWCRDYGPITIEERAGHRVLLDCGFNGWGLKFPSAIDNTATRQLAAAGIFGETPLRTVPLILEGGSIETDGTGTLLTTANCLLEGNRNPHLSREQIATALQDLLGVERVLFLDNGHLLGDDTDAHIDTLARLCPNDTICYMACDDEADEHYPALQAMAGELQQLTTAAGAPYRLLALPWPRAMYAADGHRLPATYANYLVVNGVVLVPTYGDAADRRALAVVAEAYPEHQVYGIDCRVLVEQHGSLHCMTMQLPTGVLAPSLLPSHPEEESP